MTDRIAELRALIDAEERATRSLRVPSQPSLRERLVARDEAADAMYAAMERDVPALLDCAEALRDLLMDTQHANHECDDEVYCPVKNAHAALAKLNGEGQ